MHSKQEYIDFCKKTYVPIYSKSWWLDAVCGADNWDVWLYKKGDNILAAMPYYMEKRGSYKYITKAPLTQNNGIIFVEDPNRKLVSQAKFEEEVINSACQFIESLGVDVYEQQYQTSFINWSPFFWNKYTALVRYTYIIHDTSNMEGIMEGFSSNYRKNIRKGQRMTQVELDLTPDEFYFEHEKIFSKQGLDSPISRELWEELYESVINNNAGQLICAKDSLQNIHSVMFVVWDDRRAYPILGGYMPEFSNSQSYPALTYYSIQMAHERGLEYDFEGSMIKRIAKSFRQFGGVPTPYFRIRRVFNPDIVRLEAEDQIKILNDNLKNGGGHWKVTSFAENLMLNYMRCSA